MKLLSPETVGVLVETLAALPSKNSVIICCEVPRVTESELPERVKFASAETVGVLVADVKELLAIVGKRFGITESTAEVKLVPFT